MIYGFHNTNTREMYLSNSKKQRVSFNKTSSKTDM